MLLKYKLLELLSHIQTDAYVLSFPKCGRTWYRFIIGNTIVNTYELKNIPTSEILIVKNLNKFHNQIPKIIFSHEDLPQWKRPEEIELNKSKYKNKKIILLIRDPRDVVVSNYYQKKYRGFKIKKGVNKKNFDGTISEFIRYDIGGLPSIISYYNSWADQSNIPKQFLLVKYEDLQINPQEIIIQTMELLGCNVDNKAIMHAIEDSSFEKMRAIEQSNTIINNRLKAGIQDNELSFKTRKGKVGSYKEELSESDILWIDNYINANLSNAYSFYKQL